MSSIQHCLVCIHFPKVSKKVVLCKSGVRFFLLQELPTPFGVKQGIFRKSKTVVQHVTLHLSSSHNCRLDANSWATTSVFNILSSTFILCSTNNKNPMTESQYLPETFSNFFCREALLRITNRLTWTPVSDLSYYQQIFSGQS